MSKSSPYVSPKLKFKSDSIALPKILKDPLSTNYKKQKYSRFPSISRDNINQIPPLIPFYPKFCNKLLDSISNDKKVINYRILLENTGGRSISNVTPKSKIQTITYVPNSTVFKKLNCAISLKNLDFEAQRKLTRSLSPTMMKKNKIKKLRNYSFYKKAQNPDPVLGLCPVN